MSAPIQHKTDFFIMNLALLAIVLLSLMVGAYSLELSELIEVLLYKIGVFSKEPSSQLIYLVWHIRLPRIAMGGLIGMGLAISGAAIQGLFRNPLAEPSLIGVMGGAMLFAVIFIVCGGGLLMSTNAGWGHIALSFSAFMGGLIATLLVYSIATKKGQTSTTTMLLGGVAITAITNALAGIFIYFSTESQLRDISFWTMGSLSGASWSNVWIAAIFIIPTSVGLCQMAQPLNAMLLGEREAQYLGIDIRKIKFRIVLYAAILVGVCIAMAGMIGFVGLLVPHLVRLFRGSNHQYLLPASIILGAVLLIGADTLARTIIAPAELPIGILTALLGGPFFFWLLLRNQQIE